MTSPPSNSSPASPTISSMSFENVATISSHDHRNDSADEVLLRIQDLDDVVYLGDKDILSKCDYFFDKNVNGNVLIRKNNNGHPIELLFAGIFEIDARDFFMTSDAKFNASNTAIRFDQIKPHCRLLPVRRNSQFAISADDFPTIVSNIHAIEKLVAGRKGPDDVSVVVTSQGTPTSIKLSHHLFKVC
jgi:hypothetical protein